MWLVLLKRFWPYIVGALLILGAVIWYHAQIAAAEERGENKARIAFLAELEQERETWRQHQNEVNEEIDREYQSQISKLRADASRERRGRAIRCVLDSPDQMRDGQDPGESSGSAGDRSALRASENLRPEIVRVGEQCERMRQQLIAIKNRQTRLSTE